MTPATVASRLRSRRMLVLMLFDALMLVAGFCFAGALRYSATGFADGFDHIVVIIAAAIVVQWTLGLLTAVYLGRFAVASLEEIVALGLTTAVGAVTVGICNALISPLWVARSLPFTATFLALFGMILGRALWRLRFEIEHRDSCPDGTPTLVLGASFSGESLVKSMLTAESPMRPVGFLDDDLWKRRRRVRGVPVLGTCDDLARVAAETKAEALVIAIPSASSELIKRVSDAGRAAGLAVKVLPPRYEAFAGRIGIRDVRDIDVRDLLGRNAIETDIESIVGYVTGKRVLVTGAGGSIGSELCRQIHRWGPAELIMLDRDESALHSVQLSIHGQALLDSPDVVLNDIRDEVALRQIFQARRPEVVFHAAALKHLPLLEQYPYEALKTNVLGTANVLAVAQEVGVQRFVNISTDKAADPTSVLGYSKRIAERLTADVARTATGAYMSVRFGNVLGSRGSVLTAFAQQIASGGPITVTHPEVTRYFMTVEEAVQLVIQAGALGQNGEVMILDMGQPVLIVDVARQLIEQSGKPIEIVYTGLRPGEKLHEVLWSDEEHGLRSKHPLVSHTSVAPLEAEVVRAVDMHGTHLGLLQHFEDWVVAESRHVDDEVLLPVQSERSGPDASFLVDSRAGFQGHE